MEEKQGKYQIVLDKKDKINIIKGLFKLLEEKAIGIKQTCADERISGQVYDCEIETLDVILDDIESIRNTLSSLKER